MQLSQTSRTSLKWCASVIVGSMIVTACGKKEAPKAPEPAPVVAAPTAPTAPAAPVDNAQDSLAQKLETYVSCFNKLDESANRSISRYESWVKDMKNGPTGKEMVVYGLYPIDGAEVEACKADFAKAAANKPALDKLDAAGTQYMAALSALSQTVGEAYPYYDRANYKDDKFVKGKELHAALVKNFADFKVADDAFSVELDVENDKLLAAQLADIEKKEGRKINYWHMSLMAQAKSLASEIDKEGFSPEAAATKLAAYEKTVDEAMAYSKANKAEVPTSWFTIENAAEDFRKAAKERIRRVRDKIPYNEGEKMMLTPGSAWMVEGSQEKTVKAYNSLVESSNRLN